MIVPEYRWHVCAAGFRLKIFSNMTESTSTSEDTEKIPAGRADRVLESLAHFFSFIFSPLLTPTYGIAVAFYTSYMAVLPVPTLIKVTAVVFAVTCLLPMIAIGILWKLGKVSDPGLNKQGERTLPFVISGLSYALMTVYMFMLHAPLWLCMYAISGLLIVIVCCLINLRWKISIHLAALGGMLGLITHILVGGVMIRPVLPWLLWGIIIAGAVGTARLILRRHTLAQVGAGFALGFLITLLLTAL